MLQKYTIHRLLLVTKRSKRQRKQTIRILVLNLTCIDLAFNLSKKSTLLNELYTFNPH